MHLRSATLLLMALPALAPARLAAADAELIKADEAAMKAIGLGTDGPALIEFFRVRTLAEKDREKVTTLIQGLGDDAYDVREKATDELVTLGPSAVSLLKRATRDQDIEVVRRAEHCLKLIDKVAGSAITTSAARLLADRKPGGAAEVLLAFVPFAEDDVVLDEVRHALAAVAARGGKPEKVLVEALEDKLPARRAAAAEALARSGLAGQRKEMRKYLDDADKLVRLRVGLALVDAKDKTAVPPLIALLPELPREQTWQVEDLLFKLAGEQAPNVSLGGDDASRQKCRDAWKDWWAKNGDKVDLAKLEGERPLGYTLLVQMDPRGTSGKVIELGLDGKPRWTIENLMNPWDAQVVGNDRVLIAEYRGRKVTERNFKGEVVWEKTVPNYPVSAQRLANGNTFIATRNQLIEVDRTGKEVATHTRAQGDVQSARKLRNGQTVLVTYAGVVVRLDENGKELKQFNASAVQAYTGHFDVLANGNVVVPLYAENKVVEFDKDGKAVWQVNATQPNCAVRLPNGNTLVSSQNVMAVQELDKNGKPVWDFKPEGRLMRVGRR